MSTCWPSDDASAAVESQPGDVELQDLAILALGPAQLHHLGRGAAEGEERSYERPHAAPADAVHRKTGVEEHVEPGA